METPAHPQLSRAPSRPTVTFQAISALHPDARNPRTHSKRQIRQIADSIRAFGFTNPILVDEKGSVMAGHGRLEAAKLLGIRQVPTIRIGDLTEAQKRALGYPFNRTGCRLRHHPSAGSTIRGPVGGSRPGSAPGLSGLLGGLLWPGSAISLRGLGRDGGDTLPGSARALQVLPKRPSSSATDLRERSDRLKRHGRHGMARQACFGCSRYTPRWGSNGAEHGTVHSLHAGIGLDFVEPGLQARLLCEWTAETPAWWWILAVRQSARQVPPGCTERVRTRPEVAGAEPGRQLPLADAGRLSAPVRQIASEPELLHRRLAVTTGWRKARLTPMLGLEPAFHHVG